MWRPIEAVLLEMALLWYHSTGLSVTRLQFDTTQIHALTAVSTLPAQC